MSCSDCDKLLMILYHSSKFILKFASRLDMNWYIRKKQKLKALYKQYPDDVLSLHDIFLLTSTNLGKRSE